MLKKCQLKLYSPPKVHHLNIKWKSMIKIMNPFKSRLQISLLLIHCLQKTFLITYGQELVYLESVSFITDKVSNKSISSRLCNTPWKPLYFWEFCQVGYVFSVFNVSKFLTYIPWWYITFWFLVFNSFIFY